MTIAPSPFPTPAHDRVGSGEALEGLREAIRAHDCPRSLASLRHAISADQAHALQPLALEERDALRWMFVHWRDAGHFGDALAAFQQSSRIWPNDPVFAIEILVLEREHPALLETEVQALLQRMSPLVRSSCVVDLLLARRSGRLGDWEQAFRGLKRVLDRPDPAIRNYFQDLHALAVSVFAGWSDVQAGGADRQAPLDVSPTLDAYLLAVDQVGALDDILRSITYLNVFGLDDPVNQVLASLGRIQTSLGVEGLGGLIMLLLSRHRQHQAREVVEAGLADPASLRSPLFVKAAVGCAIAQRDALLERTLLSGFAVAEGDGQTHPVTRARVAEIMARRRSVMADRPLRVFVGLFGQSRAAGQTIPQTIDKVIRAFDAATVGAFEVSFGMATWLRPGHRVLDISHPTAFFLEVVPVALHPLFMDERGLPPTATARLYPNLVHGMIEYTRAQCQVPVTVEDLSDLFPADRATILVDDEDEVEAEARRALEAGGHMGRVDHLNQYKMWSRISRLRDALEQEAARQGAPFDACVLMRSDLQYEGGDLANIVCRAVSAFEADRVFCDNDPHAEFIEGLGDRYLIASAANADILFDGYRYKLNLASSVGDEAAGRQRMAGHELLHRILFERGRTPSPLTGIHYLLRREQIPAMPLIEALRRDLDGVADAEARSRVMAAIASLSGPPQ